MRLISLCRILLPLVLLAGLTGTVNGQDCSNTCESDLSDTLSDTYYTLPSGTQLIVVIAPAIDGTGNQECTSTCTPCKNQFSVSFYGNGTGNCISVNHNFAGWSTPDDDFSRPGWLTALCDHTDFLDIVIGGCGGLPGTYVYEEFLVLICGC